MRPGLPMDELRSPESREGHYATECIVDNIFKQVAHKQATSEQVTAEQTVERIISDLERLDICVYADLASRVAQLQA